jgi:hypothetical protein
MRNAMIAASVILIGIAANLGLLSSGGEPQASPLTGGTTAAPKSTAKDKSPSDAAENNAPIMKLYEVDDPNNTYYQQGVESNICKASISKHSNGPDYCTEEEKNINERFWGELRNKNVEFVIATVPDPVETRLTVLFDRSIETILQTAAEECYTFDRFWVPWRKGPVTESDDPVKRLAAAQLEAARRSLPGILIFRQTDPSCRMGRSLAPQTEILNYTEPSLLAVFLVGETPNAGIHQDQFFRAVYYTAALGLRNKLRGILGPMFSGSFASMQRARSDAAIQLGDPDLKELKIYSGSATGKSVDGLEVLPMLSEDASYLEMVRKNLVGPVLVLNEESTTYGRNISAVTSELHDSYPRDISALRNAQQEMTRGSSPTLQNAQSQISFSLRDTESGFDSVPRFATTQTPVTQEAVMLHIAESIRRQGVKTVVVTSTNVLDSLFLTRFLRQADPDVRVVTFDSDLLFVHGTDSADYAGSLAVVNHPLNPEILRQDDDLRFPNHGLARFNSNISAGIHAALRSLLRGETLNKPDRWLTIIGRGVYWPVRVEIADPDKKFNFEASSPTRAGSVFYGLAGFLGLASAGLYFFAVTRGKKLIWCAELRPRKRGYHLIAGVAGIFALCAIGYPPAYLWLHGQKGWGGPALWIALAVTACFASTIHAFGGKAKRFWPLGIVIVAILFWKYAHPLALSSADPTEYFRAIRSADPTNGVSPNVPVIFFLFAIAWWAWCNKRRLMLAEDRDPGVEPIDEMPEGLFRSLSSILGQRVLGGHWAWGAGAAGLAITILLHSKLNTLESSVYNAAIVLLTGIVVGLVALSAFGLVEIWLLLRRLLRAFDSHPLRAAYKMLPPVGSWSPIWPEGRRITYVGLSRMVDTLDLLHVESPNYCPKLEPDTNRLRNHVRSITESILIGTVPDMGEVQKMRFTANFIVKKLCVVLNNSSWKKGALESMDKLRDRDKGAVKLDPDATAALLAAEAVAIRYVSLIRYAMLQIKNQMSVLSVGFVLSVIAINSYPFQGAGYLRWCITVGALLLGLIVIDIFIEMEKDATLNRLTDQDQGKVGRDFYLKVISAGVIPLLAAVGSHFPSAGRLLFSWLQPALSALR